MFSPASVASALCVSLLVSACSVSFPMSSFVDHAPTGAISDAKASKVLSPALDREDLRRAQAALAVALDPQGNGTSVAWINPESGAHGSFVALAPPFPDHDGICRAFRGDILVRPHPGRKVKGSACRDPGGDWSIADMSETT